MPPLSVGLGESDSRLSVLGSVTSRTMLGLSELPCNSKSGEGVTYFCTITFSICPNMFTEHLHCKAPCSMFEREAECKKVTEETYIFTQCKNIGSSIGESKSQNFA